MRQNEDRFKMLLARDRHCLKCGAKQELQVGHVIWNGSWQPHNIGILCAPCNKAMGRTFDPEFAAAVRENADRACRWTHLPFGDLVDELRSQLPEDSPCQDTPWLLMVEKMQALQVAGLEREDIRELTWRVYFNDPEALGREWDRWLWKYNSITNEFVRWARSSG